ncbi:MAG: ABC transporter permease, partial [Kordiimonadaceae bacterium]|nr:ABC transporter permease [Kordiimonadaceae bacterium]
MLNHYFKSAIRGILRDKQYFTINVLGLAIALSTVILIALFVSDELSYDKWLNDVDRVYKIESINTSPGSEPVKVSYTPGTMAPGLLNNFASDLDGAVRIYENETSVKVGATQFNETVDYVDHRFFDLFQIPIVSGTQDMVLSNSNNIAISEKMAIKYFGVDNPIGKMFDINHSPSSSRIDYQVVAVFKDLPQNSHLKMDFIALLEPSRYVAWPWVTEDWNSLTNHT